MMENTAANKGATTRLMHSNSLTLAYKNISSMQHEIMVLIVEKLQDYVTTDEAFFENYPMVPDFELDVSDICDPRNKAKVLHSIDGLRNIDFTFRQWHPRYKKYITFHGAIISTVGDIENTSRVLVTINHKIIPGITYCGEHVGGTLYLKELTLADEGKYNKLIRQLIQSRSWLGFWKVSVEEFRRIIGAPERMENKDLRKKILEPARRWILDHPAKEWFDYEFFSGRAPAGKRPQYDMLYFTIYHTDDGRSGRRTIPYEQYSTIYAWMKKISGDPCSHAALDATDAIMDKGTAPKMLSRIRYYRTRMETGEITPEHALNNLRKIVREDCGICISPPDAK